MEINDKYSKMKKEELLKLAEKAGIPGYKDMKLITLKSHLRVAELSKPEKP